jgi:hypothetical protein
MSLIRSFFTVSNIASGLSLGRDNAASVMISAKSTAGEYGGGFCFFSRLSAGLSAFAGTSQSWPGRIAPSTRLFFK